MLTDAANGANTPPRAVMLSVAEIAQRDGVAKPTVSIAVKRLVERHGLTVERDGQGRVARVNVAEYDHLRGRFGDPSKAQAPTREPQPLPGTGVDPSETYDEALRQKTWHEAEKRRLELEEIKGNLVRKDSLRAGLSTCAEAIVRALDRMPQGTDAILLAGTKDGERGARMVYREQVMKARAEVAAALAALASGGAEPDAEPDAQDP